MPHRRSVNFEIVTFAIITATITGHKCESISLHTQIRDNAF